MLHCTIMCNILNTNPLKEQYMKHFNDQQKQFEEVLDRTQAAYEFWAKTMFTAIKELFNTTKTK